MNTEGTVGPRGDGTIPCLAGEPGRLYGPREGKLGGVC